MEYSHRKLAEMCKKINNANFARPEEYVKFRDFAKPLIEKVNKPQYIVTKQEAEFLLKFYAKQSLMNLGIGRKINIEIYSKATMIWKYGRGNGKALPDGVKGVIAVSNPTDSKIIYSEQLIDDIASGNPDEMYRAFRTVMHETKHIEQSYRREYSEKGYILALETMAMHVDPYFYLNNYWGTYRECDAEEYGMNATIFELPGLHRVTDKRNLRESNTNFEAGKSGKTKTVIGRLCNEKGNIVLPGSEYPEGERIRILELIAEDYIEKHPKKAFEEFPILRVAFRDNGKRKSIDEMLGNMYELVEEQSSSAKATAIEDLYLTVIANRYPDNYERDSAEVYSFIRNHRMKKLFVEKLERVIRSMRGQDLRKRKIKRDFYEYGVGMSSADKRRRREYFKSGFKRKVSKTYAMQYYLEPGKFQDQDNAKSISSRYKIDVPIIEGLSKVNDTKENENISRDTSEEGR